MKYDFDIDMAEENSSHAKLLERIQPGSSVLELGCATGYLSDILTHLRGCRVVGVEIDPDAAERARAHCEQVVVADLDNDDLKDRLAGRSFDVILCADVLEHLKDPAKTLKSLTPLLAPEGRLLASVPNVAHASIRLELLQGHFDYEKLGLLDDTHLHFYTRDGLVNMLMEAGFVCYDIDYTLHDMADEAIAEHLSAMGLAATKQALDRFHTEEAAAYQFIVEARPAHPDVLKHRAPILQPKPLASSVDVYGKKQERIVNLEQQLALMTEHAKHLERHVQQLEQNVEGLTVHNDNRQRHIEQLSLTVAQYKKEIEALNVHNDNRQRHIDALAEKYNALVQQHDVLAARFQSLQSDASDMETRLRAAVVLAEQFQPLSEHNRQLQAHIDHLQAILDRLNGRFLFRSLRFVKRRLSALRRALVFKRVTAAVHDVNDYRLWVERYATLTKQDLVSMKDDIAKQPHWPKIALLMPVFNTRKELLIDALESVLGQVYPYWELCIADDCSDQAHVKNILKRYVAKDARIKTVFRQSNGHISAASNSALELVEADYVALLDHDDVLSPDALYRIGLAIKQHPEAELIYSDEDKLDSDGHRYAPYFKPDWNPDLLTSHNFICHLGVYRTEMIKAVGGFRSEFDGAQDYDLALRCVERIEPARIIHIPRVLYHWRAAEGSTANGIHEKPYAVDAMQAVMREALARRGLDADVLTHERLPGALRVRYKLPARPPKVTMVIPTRNGFTLVKRCIESILERTDYPDYEIILVDNGSDDIVAVRYFRELARNERIRVIRDDSPFNYAAINNRAAALANGEVIALLNNDLEVINDDWLAEMVALAVRDETGAVGAKLLYPNDTLQHCGVIVGLGGVAGHSHKHFPKDHPGFCGRLLLTQNLSAVTAACLVVKKSVFDAVGGFDEEHLTVAFNDVDLCLRIREQGYWNVWTPYAQMYHYESASRGYEDTPEKQARFSKEIEYMKTRWGDSLLQDPAYNPNLTLDREDFSLAWPPR
ncbi:MAG: glycosyltransferase [Gammaproteobacteria bacterium]